MKETKLRIAKIEDAAELLEIYSYYVNNTAITFEFDPPTLETFEGRMRATLENYPYIVAEQDGVIVGYTYAGKFKDRPAYHWCVETSVYVHKDHRLEGIGRILYEALEDMLRAQNILNVNACIAYPAEEDPFLTRDSVFFHEKIGYRLVGEFHKCGYKFNRWYNMVWMEKMIGEHKAMQDPVIPFSQIVGKLKETL